LRRFTVSLAVMREQAALQRLSPAAVDLRHERLEPLVMIHHRWVVGDVLQNLQAGLEFVGSEVHWSHFVVKAAPRKDSNLHLHPVGMSCFHYTTGAMSARPRGGFEPPPPSVGNPACFRYTTEAQSGSPREGFEPPPPPLQGGAL